MEKILQQHAHGVITEGERYNKVIDVWQHTTNNIAQVVKDTLEKECENARMYISMGS